MKLAFKRVSHIDFALHLSLHDTLADATDSKVSKSCSVDRTRDSLTALSDVLPNLTSKIAACPFLSSSVSHTRRMHLEESIVTWNDRSLLRRTSH